MKRGARRKDARTQHTSTHGCAPPLPIAALSVLYPSINMTLPRSELGVMPHFVPAMHGTSSHSRRSVGWSSRNEHAARRAEGVIVFGSEVCSLGGGGSPNASCFVVSNVSVLPTVWH